MRIEPPEEVEEYYAICFLEGQLLNSGKRLSDEFAGWLADGQVPESRSGYGG